MMAKLLGIVGSIRFWLITLAAASVYVGLLQSNGFDWKTLLDTIASWLAVVAGVGTIDKFGTNLKK